MKINNLIVSITLVSCLTLSCSQGIEEPLVVKAPTLRLVDGSLLSLDTADDYNPILLYATTGSQNLQLYLLFASNRSCEGCEGHNLFITKAQSGALIDLPKELPPFELPQPIKPGGNLINSNSPLSFAAFPVYSQIYIYYNTKGAPINIKKMTYSTINNSTSATQNINNSPHSSHTIIGQVGSYLLLGRDAQGNVRLFDPEENLNQLSPPIEQLNNALAAIEIHHYVTGYYNSLFYLQGGKIWLAGRETTAAPLVLFAEQKHLSSNLAKQRLILQSLHVGGNFFEPHKSSLLFAAHNGKSLDIYAVTSHSLEELWTMVVPPKSTLP